MTDRYVKKEEEREENVGLNFLKGSSKETPFNTDAPFENNDRTMKEQNNHEEVGGSLITFFLSHPQLENLRSQLDSLDLIKHPIPGFISSYDPKQYSRFKRHIIANLTDLYDTFEPCIDVIMQRAIELDVFTPSCQNYALSLVKENPAREAVRELVSLFLRGGSLGMQILYEFMTHEQRLAIFYTVKRTV